MAVLISLFSFFWYHSYVRQSMAQAAEFNLQLIEGVTDAKMASVLQLARWCSSNLQISDYFGTTGDNTKARLEAYDRIVEEISNSSVSYYIRRFIITDLNGKVIQAGNRTQQSIPLNEKTILSLTPLIKKQLTLFEYITRDPLSTEENDFIVPIVQPVLDLYTKKFIAYVYIGVSAEIFTDQLKNYYIEPDSGFYLTLGSSIYDLSDIGRKKDLPDFSSAQPYRLKTVHVRTATGRIRDNLKTRYFVQYPFQACSGGYTQILSQQQDHKQMLLFAGIMAVVILLLIVFSLILRRILTGLIGKPVSVLKKRMAVISSGDFSPDPSIEWNDEFGTIGKGINSLSQNVLNLMQIKVDNEKQKRELEYRMLQSQINPHFLYNTLNSIRWMATIQNAPGIAEMVTALASLLKNISNNTAEELTLRDELNLLDDYFVIQKYRYGGSVSMNVEIGDKKLLDAFIPRFTLQPLIENAIFHGIEPKDTPGVITITVTGCTLKGRASDIEIGIMDNGIGMSTDEIQKALSGESGNKNGLFRQVGLANVNKRLIYAFGDQYGISITSRQGQFTRVTVLIPGPGTKHQ